MTVAELLQAAKDRRSVTGWLRHRPSPASVVQHLPFVVVLGLLPRLELYEPPGGLAERKLMCRYCGKRRPVPCPECEGETE